METNLAAGWIGIVLGVVAGAVLGLFFWREDWLGGYGSWRRRMIRLAHVSFFGVGFINVASALTVSRLATPSGGAIALAATCLLAGAVTMPLVCYLAAWKLPLRHLFPIPVLAIALGVSIVAIRVILR